MIYAAFGSGGTIAGLAVGLAAAGLPARVVAVRVTDPLFANRTTLAYLVRRTVAHLRHLDARFPDVADIALENVSIDTAELGEGYGVATERGREAGELARADGLALEPTYTAKTLAALLRDARAADRPRPDGAILYWHTLSGVDLSALLAGAPPLDAALVDRLRS